MLKLFYGLLLSVSLATPAYAQATPRILIYSATRAFRHDSIPTALDAIRATSDTLSVQFDATEDQSRFTDSVLAEYDAIMFLSTTGEVLDTDGKAAFQKWLNLGGNFIAIHAASDSLNTTDFYVAELGAAFDHHPALQKATINVIGPAHPSTSKLPLRWEVTDEMYNFKSDPRAHGAVVILSADESTYTDTGTRKFDQGSPHPTAWFQEHGAGVNGGIAGRSFYTSLGHLNETWQDDNFMQHIMGGIEWSLKSNTTRAYNSSAFVGNSTAPSLTTASAGGSASSVSVSSTSGSSSAQSNAVSSGSLQNTFGLLSVCLLFSACGTM